MTPEDIVARYSILESQRTTVQGTWQMIERFIAPYRGKFFTDNPGEGGIEWNKRTIFDSTAVMAAQSLASSLHGSLTNPAVKWFDLQWRSTEMRENHAASVWIENACQKVYDALQDSNFNLEINETYRDLTSYGTSVIVEEPNAEMSDPWRGITFTSVPLKEAYFEPDDMGGCRLFLRHMQWRASKVVSKFGDEVSERVRLLNERGSDEQIDILMCIYPREMNEELENERVLTPENRPWGYKYIEMKGAHLLKEGGYYEMPAYVPRWLTTSESVWGNSPAMVALADVLTLNRLVELSILAVEKAVDPVILAEERSIFTDLNLSPGSVNVVRNIERIKPFESAARFDVFQLKMDDLRRAINRYFFIDQLELKESPAMTATEVQVRYELMQRLMAATMSRLRHDMLDPIVQRTFALLFRAGELGEMPDDAKGAEMDIEYIGPLSRSQRFDQSASLERWLGQLQGIATIAPQSEQILLVPDWNAVARMSARNLNLPTKLMRSEDDVAADIEKQKTDQNRQQNADVAKTESETLANVAALRDAPDQPEAPV